jgi:hypothetical protein
MKWLRFAIHREIERIAFKLGGDVYVGSSNLNDMTIDSLCLKMLSGMELKNILTIKLNHIKGLNDNAELSLSIEAKEMLKNILHSLDDLCDLNLYIPEIYSVDSLSDELIIRFLYFYNTKELYAVEYLQKQGLSMMEALLKLSEIYRSQESDICN